MGALDLVKPTIEKICGGLHFGRLLMKPGKPATFSSIFANKVNSNESGEYEKLIFGLPGIRYLYF